MRIRKAAFIVVVFAGLAFNAVPAFAQDSSWGASVDFTPKWEILSFLEDRFFESDTDITGDEFRVGLLRGKALEGDWGVEFVRARIKNGSSISDVGTFTTCINDDCQSVDVGERYYFRDASMTGLQVHKYMPFVTVADRVQFGVNVGGGVLWVRGTAEKHDIQTQFVARPGGGHDLLTVETIELVQAKEVFDDKLGFSVLPTGRVEAVVAVVVTRNLKLKVGTGINFPGQHRVTFGAAWLF